MPKPTSPTSLLENIDRDIDDIDTYLVYADCLQQQGDPRGEFILLCRHRLHLTGSTTGRRRHGAGRWPANRVARYTFLFKATC